MLLNLSFSAFLGHPDTPRILATEEFHQCFNTIILERSADQFQIWVRGFQRAYDKSLRYFRALRVVDRVVNAVLRLRLSSECKKSLLKMSHCAQCAGLPGESKTCIGLCQNTLRGCLLDLGDLVEPIRDFSHALIAMKDLALAFNVYTQITFLETYIFRVTLFEDYIAIATEVSFLI